ncbi:condensation domain-containing protein [Streptomyces sp. NPDC049687]|uniref:condensation domain-containing protein n=1 Tax=Streptomyces sp. NPDC049687 TaxID=3365596 RepID=UPI00378E7D1A
MTRPETDLRARLARLTPQQRAALKARLAPPPEEELPLSPAQFGIWLFEQLQPGSTAYHNPAAVRLRGRLDADAVREALWYEAGRHEALRCRVVENDEGLPVHAPVDGDAVDFTVTEVPGADEAALLRAVTASARRPFDLERGPLWRAALIRAAPDDHVLVVTFHHLISDGWTLGLFLREFLAAYGALSAGRTPALPPLPASYADAVRAVRTPAARRAESLRHWKEVLAGAPTAIALPGRRPSDGIGRQGGSVVFTLDAAETAGLRAACRARGISLFSGVTALFLDWLRRHTGQNDLVVTTAVADRRAPETQQTIGCFLNTVPVRVRLPEEGDRDALLGRTGAAVADAVAHADVPFGEICAAVGQASRGEDAISNVMVLHANVDDDEQRAAGLRLTRYPVPLIASKHDLGLLITPGRDRIRCELEYREGVLAEDHLADVVRALSAAAAAAGAPDV